VQALLATEDAGFYEHKGVDIRAILGAIWANVRHGYGARGGSTLTQQLVKRLFFSPEKTIKRKISEMLLALQVEALYANYYVGTHSTDWAADHAIYKDHLLELYLNTVFFGANSYGIGDAAETFFAKRPQDLSLPEVALLIGLPNAPSAYNPLRHPDRATRRMRHVLGRMQSHGVLAAADYDRYAETVVADLLDVRRQPLNPTPFWAEAVRAEVISLWGEAALSHGALRIHTTLDMRLQRAAEEAIDVGVTALDERLGFEPYAHSADAEKKDYVQAALVCLDPHRGHVRAMVGGRDIYASHYNRALWARRQPGSGFKPVVYLAALNAGLITPLSLFVDEQKSYDDHGRLWKPRNFGDSYLGLTTAAWALINSANSTAVQITQRVGPSAIVDLARAMGFAGDLRPNPSIGLGAHEVTVMEMASAYGTLAASGIRVEPTLVERITDTANRTLFDHRPAVRQVVAAAKAYELVQIMKQVVDRGTGRRVRSMGFDRPAAGKTGTTNDNTDAWFSGFTPDLVTSVWVGFDDKRRHRLVDDRGLQITGSSGAAPIWTTFMKQAVKGTRSVDFQMPAGVRLVEVEPRTGTSLVGLPDSLRRRLRPLRIALVEPEQVNSRDEVLQFEVQADTALIDSVLMSAWSAEADVSTH
ncbi:MAG: PBP1A family penicillin-binding protein, partial [Gemmatimonadetes bacterium]|nr:PBP1A family penicillin-binding protein [Gemmatimonadota bacterium]